MILRSVFSYPDDPYQVFVRFDEFPCKDLNKMKKWIRKRWKDVNPNIEVQFKYFYTEDDFDDL